MKTQPSTPAMKHQIVSWIYRSALGLLIYTALVFLSAGKMDWLWGWVFIGMMALVLACHALVLVPTNPELLAERSRGLRQPDAKPWDLWVASVSGGFLPVGSWIIAGLDVRFGWSQIQVLWPHLLGLGLSIVGWVIFFWAMASNPFFSEAVRIQHERGHRVASGGPYQIVRHPGYSGSCLTFLGAPLLLGSWWALIPALLAAAGYVMRTELEDRTLNEELVGYKDYSDRVRYKLLPGIW